MKLKINTIWAINALLAISMTILFLSHYKPVKNEYTITIPGVGTFPPEWAVLIMCVAGIVWCAKALTKAATDPDQKKKEEET